MARDMPVRWALEEVGQPYEVRLLSFADMKRPAHMALQPFGQIPTYEEGSLVLFESGAIIHHIAASRDGLLPSDRDGRASAVGWMFAALNTIEPPIVEREHVEYTEADRSWYHDRFPLIDDRIRQRLALLSARLGDSEWLEGDFSAGDLMMVTVLRRLGDLTILDEFPNLARFVARGEARPAFQRAYADQFAVFHALSRN